jgi:hypothetical protein
VFCLCSIHPVDKFEIFILAVMNDNVKYKAAVDYSVKVTLDRTSHIFDVGTSML